MAWKTNVFCRVHSMCMLSYSHSILYKWLEGYLLMICTIISFSKQFTHVQNLKLKLGKSTWTWLLLFFQKTVRKDSWDINIYFTLEIKNPLFPKLFAYWCWDSWVLPITGNTQKPNKMQAFLYYYDWFLILTNPQFVDDSILKCQSEF